MDNSYRERQDPALTVRFELEPAAGDPGPVEVWAWTTTPWTLPSNLALAVGPEIEYALFEQAGKRTLLGAAAAAKYEKELAGATRVATLMGHELVGRSYRPLFPFFAGHPNAFRILAGGFVDTAEGTGVVHMAPGFGEDDQALCAENGIAVVCPVDEKGNFTADVPDWQGQNVLEANKPIIAELKKHAVVVRHDTIVHSYPHCWRTDQPLIYRAMSSWYVQVTAFRDRMVELNRGIHWIPEHVRDGQFGKWLEGARDWSISRNRFWGSPIPVWRSDDPRYPRIDVYGSLAELQRDFGVEITDLHRPTVDELTRPNPDDPTGKSTMRRVEDVLDGWFESGSMPFAQVHYPFENKEWFDGHFPADFIVEYVAQTRGWFYTLMVLGTALFDRPPFQNCICHGVVVAEDGQKLSKRLRNYPDPEEVFRTLGADALRWYLVSSPILRGGDLAIDRDGKSIAEVVRLVLNPIWNAYSFFSLYANADGLRARVRTDAQGVLDRYVLCKLRVATERVTASMDAYDLAGACQEIRVFLDALNNWYIRRSRARFWKDALDQDKRDAYDTLYTVLTTLCRLCAPFLPLVTEEVYRGLTGATSVHLADWPVASDLPSDEGLVRAMDRVREVCSAALGLREEKRLRVRLPLARLVVAAEWAAELEPFKGLVASEVNVKHVEASTDTARYATFGTTVNARLLGPRLGPRLKAVLAATRDPKAGFRRLEGDEAELQTADGEWVHLQAGEWSSNVQPNPEAGPSLGIVGLSDRQSVVALDTEVTPELEREGLARDLVRLIQQERKSAGLHVSDRIRVRLTGDERLAAALAAHRDYVAEQTLAVELEMAAPEAGMHTAEGKVGEASATVALARVAT